MAGLKHGLLLVAFTSVAVPGLVFGTAACSKLTEPSGDQPMASADPQAAALQSALAQPADPGERDKAKAKAAALASALASGAPAASSAAPVPDEKPGIKDTVVGKGAEAKTGDTVSVHYTGTLTDGKEFDSSKKHGKPFDFPLGGGRVIKCWDQGVVGMKVGGKRTLTCPPSIAYGARGFPPVIPPNSTLNFDVELLEIKSSK